MKLLATALLAATLCSGCALFPKDVEFFQKKVKPVPELSDSARERQREAADYAAREIHDARQAQLRGDQTNAVSHVNNADRVAGALSQSMGPPLSPYTGRPDKIASRILHDQAELNEDLQSYSDRTDTLAGKKIEGTGLIRMGYFTFVGLVIGFFALIWVGLRIYGIFNPVVGGATGIIGRVAASTLHTGFTELVDGGQQFLQWVKDSQFPAETKQWIENTFKLAHQTQQSPATQGVVDKLTASNITSVAQPVATPATVKSP